MVAKGGSEREGEGGKVDSVVEKNKEERSREEKRRRLYELAAILAGTTASMNIEGGPGDGCGWRRVEEVVACGSRSLCTAACSPFLMPRAREGRPGGRKESSREKQRGGSKAKRESEVVREVTGVLALRVPAKLVGQSIGCFGDSENRRKADVGTNMAAAAALLREGASPNVPPCLWRATEIENSYSGTCMR